MKLSLPISTLLLLFISFHTKVYSQPANDNCAGAFNVVISDNEENVVLTNGDTRGATASTSPAFVCSAAFFSDDIFFKFMTPAVIEEEGFVIRVYFDPSSVPTDVPAIGMALYESCNSDEEPLLCFSSTVLEDDHSDIIGICLLADHTYILRVWSTGSDASTEGTLRVGIYPNNSIEPSLWWETFGDGLTVNGWTTFGTCDNPDSNNNAFFKYLPEGLIDSGAFAAVGTRIVSASFCDGAVGVDSDFNDNAGTGNPNTGACSTPGTKFLVSPVLFSGDWDVSGLSLTWTQAIRQFQSTYAISFRTWDVGSDWADWTDIPVNTEFPINSIFFLSDVQRFFLPGAAGHDSIQIRFIYNDDYYFWAIDDVKILETECNNSRVQSNFFAIAPFANIPSNQVFSFAALSDIFNAGACPLTNVVLNHTVKNLNTNEIIYDEDLEYGTVEANTLVENRLIPKLIELPEVSASYSGTYTLTQDSADFNPADNVISFNYSVEGNTFALEDGFTRSVAVNSNIYTQGAPLSYAYGNYFRPVADVKFESITWGVNNPADMAGKTVNVYLLEWTDSNGNQIAESSERQFIGVKDITFSGLEGDNAIFETTLENFDHPGEAIIMKGGMGYMAIIEYVASLASDPQFFMLASEARDYNAQQLAMDTAVAKGLATNPLYLSILGFSPDGNIANVDYEVKELNVNDSRIFFGNSIVPLVRMNVSEPDTTNTKDELPENNLISVYPNPVSDEIQVKMEFAKPYRDIQLRLINNLGQTIYRKVLSSIMENHIEPINVSQIAAGNYMLQIETPDGQRTLPLIVAR